MHLATLLATAPPDTLISGNWLIAAIGAIASAAALILGKRQGKQEATMESRSVTIESQPVSTNTEIIEPVATVRALDSLRADMHSRLKKIETQLETERTVARTANSNIHSRIDKVAENIAGVRERLDEVNSNVRLVLAQLLNNHKESP